MQRTASLSKKGKRKVQEVPQSQAATLPRYQEEEETDKNQTTSNQTNLRKALRLALSSPNKLTAQSESAIDDVLYV